MTDYNDGKWHGWNGGECPVHPESIVDHVWRFVAEGCTKSTLVTGTSAGNVAFSEPSFGNVIAFRVTKPYVAPEEYTGECYAHHYTSTCPTFTETHVGPSIPGKYVAIHINGRLSKIIWEADE